MSGEMLFVECRQAQTITYEVNKALADGYEYLETKYNEAWILVILRRP